MFLKEPKALKALAFSEEVAIVLPKFSAFLPEPNVARFVDALIPAYFCYEMNATHPRLITQDGKLGRRLV